MTSEVESIRAIIPSTETRELSTYSMWQAFGNCPKFFEWQYEKLLSPIKEPPALSLGKLFARWIDAYQRKEPIEVTAELSLLDQREKALFFSMTRAYLDKYTGEDLEYLHSELPFWGPILNPETGAESRTFILGGRVDAVAKKPDGSLWLKETKTASNYGREYLDRLWSDFQITLYSHYLRVTKGLMIQGVIYDVVEKCAYRPSAKDLVPSDYEDRVEAWYHSGERLHREEIILHEEQTSLVLSDLWDKTQRLLAMRRSGRFFYNSNACFRWNMPCKFFDACRSGGNPAVLQNQYVTRKNRHPELEGQD